MKQPRFRKVKCLVQHHISVNVSKFNFLYASDPFMLHFSFSLPLSLELFTKVQIEMMHQVENTYKLLLLWLSDLLRHF